MVDTHCHLDYYPNPALAAEQAAAAGITVIFVTNTPAAFQRAYPHVRSLRNIRLAIGLHPLHAAESRGEWNRFRELVQQTSYVGEVGLDFSALGVETKLVQIAAFRFVLESIRKLPRFVTIHSRGAETAVLDSLEEMIRHPVVFHWYTGNLSNIDRALSSGHYFSINLSMLASAKGRRIIGRLPPNRVLLESDGPFARVSGRSAVPKDVSQVIVGLGKMWNVSILDAQKQISTNLWDLLKRLQMGGPAFVSPSKA
ncbi:MAG TPA: Qat anti-phage system TatD family nuclease QatD [Candidatus Angelobacter sp.]|jgi:TatD DNase family protein|nr:Qat anti-phage system TatD family nuclease QatD [Candidatus Angelobacter sp.]